MFSYLGGYTRMGVEQRNGAVLELAAEGMSNAAIARSLGISPDTAAAIVHGEAPQERRRRWETSSASEVEAPETSSASEVEAPDQFIDLAAMQKGADLAAKHDEMAAFYGAIKALSVASLLSRLPRQRFAQRFRQRRQLLIVRGG